jgi:hypothetical protein
VSCRGISRIFVYLAWRLWQSVLRLAVRGNSISGRVVRRQRVPVFEMNRLPSTASQRGKRWVSCRGKPRIIVHSAWRFWKSVLRLAVREIVVSVGLFGVRGCRCLRSIDCRRPEVDGPNGG